MQTKEPCTLIASYSQVHSSYSILPDFPGEMEHITRVIPSTSNVQYSCNRFPVGINHIFFISSFAFFINFSVFVMLSSTLSWFQVWHLWWSPIKYSTGILASSLYQHSHLFSMVVNVTCFNVRSLNHPAMRASLWKESLKLGCDLICMQKTHFQSSALLT